MFRKSDCVVLQQTPHAITTKLVRISLDSCITTLPDTVHTKESVLDLHMKDRGSRPQ